MLLIANNSLSLMSYINLLHKLVLSFKIYSCCHVSKLVVPRRQIVSTLCEVKYFTRFLYFFAFMNFIQECKEKLIINISMSHFLKWYIKWLHKLVFCIKNILFVMSVHLLSPSHTFDNLNSKIFHFYISLHTRILLLACFGCRIYNNIEVPL